MKQRLFNAALTIAALLMISAQVFAASETNDLSTIQGFDTTEIIVVFTSILAFILGSISFMAYRLDRRTKFVFVTIAFFIFAFKGILIIGSDLLSLQQPVLDIIASLLDFAVLLCFFIGMVKK